MALVYDVHTHVGLDQGFRLREWWPYAATAQDLLQHIEAHGIDRAVCFSFTLPSAFDPYAFADRGAVELLPGRVPFDRENPLLVQEVERIAPDGRLLPFAMFDPGRCVADQLANLEKLAGRIAGLKTQTTIIESPIRSLIDGGRGLMEFAERQGLPVLLHVSQQPRAVWAQVSDGLAVAEAFPGVRFSLAHSLGFHAEHLRRAAQMPNLWVDCAAHLANCQLAREDSPIMAPHDRRVDADYSRPADVLEAVHDVLGGKYMWGSDNPFMSWCDDELRIMNSYAGEAAVLRALPERVRVSMGSRAPAAWLFGERNETA
jgi:hypothetical protein